MNARLLTAAAAAAAAAALLTLLPSGERDPLADVDLAERMRECVQLQQQAGDGNISEPAFLCSYEVMRSGILTGRYGMLLAQQQIYTRPEMWATCHAAGHSLGPDLIAAGMEPEEIILRLFDGKPQESTDHFCTASVIHGLIDGISRGAKAEDLAVIAEHCGRAGEAHSYYGNECAHYMGHAVWVVHQEIGPDAAASCRLLDVQNIPGGMESCLGGAAMEKYELQDAAYGLESGTTLEPPPIEEIRQLCRLLEQAEERARDGCWGGAGWLLSTHLQRRMNELDPRGAFETFPEEKRQEAVAVHMEILAVCESQNCASTLMQHMRPVDWSNGVGELVCESEEAVEGSRFSLEAACAASIYSGITG